MGSTPLWTTPLLALAASMVLHALALKLFPHMGLVDFPKRYGLTRSPIPYPTGIIAILLFCIFLAFTGPLTTQTIALLSAIIILGSLCFADDRMQLSPFLRLGVQLLIAILLFLNGVRIYTLTNPLSGLIGGPVISLDKLNLAVAPLGSIPLWSGLFTLLWLGLTINALNWFDGIPGQVSTLSAISFLTIGFLALSIRVNQPSLGLLAFILAGLALGGLLFDFPPPRLLMGDTGAMFFGLMIGVLTIYSGGKVATAFLVLGVPLIDLFFVVVRRLLKGRSPLRGNAQDEHLHHRLLQKGWSPRQVILSTALVGAIFGSAALFMDTLEKFITAVLLFLLMLALSVYSKPDAKKI